MDDYNFDLKRQKSEERTDLPDYFDAREKWTNCKIISNVWNQGPCASCWAISTANMISDRICIQSNGSIQIEISVENLITCCKNCSMLDGCRGGDPRAALWYYYSHGIVTGGPYNSSEGCQPYSLPPCAITPNSTLPVCEDTDHEPSSCSSNCSNVSYGSSYQKDLYKAASPPYKITMTEEEIKSELFINGPLISIFQAHIDFIYYQGGIYHTTKNSEPIMWHSAKLIGWGNENNTPYWLVINSWGREWGENGTFKIIRGLNECCFESHVMGIIPETQPSRVIL